MNMLIIDNQRDLDKLCTVLVNYPTISIDTEFFRERTYFAKLSLIQIMTKDCQVIIDALCNIDLSSFNKILLNDKITKIFHAPREDLEIFYHLFKKLPKNVFDIQIAATVCNLGKYLGYADICRKICSVEVDKTYQRSNWLKRPIDSKMAEYAIRDVQYLSIIYETLSREIKNNDLQAEYDSKMQSLLNIENYVLNVEGAWKKVKFDNQARLFTDKIKILAAYREEQAIKLNIPRKHFFTDTDLIKICQYLPITKQDLKKLQFSSFYLSKEKYAVKVIELCMGMKHI